MRLANSCGNIYYCGAQCQKTHWKEHKKTCPKILRKKLEEAKGEGGDRVDNEVAQAQLDLGGAHLKHGKHLKAVKCFDEALCILKELGGDDSPNVATACRNLGVAYVEMGRLHESLARTIESAALFGATGLGIRPKPWATSQHSWPSLAGLMRRYPHL